MTTVQTTHSASGEGPEKCHLVCGIGHLKRKSLTREKKISWPDPQRVIYGETLSFYKHLLSWEPAQDSIRRTVISSKGTSQPTPRHIRAFHQALPLSLPCWDQVLAYEPSGTNFIQITVLEVSGGEGGEIASVAIGIAFLWLIKDRDPQSKPGTKLASYSAWF